MPGHASRRLALSQLIHRGRRTCISATPPGVHLLSLPIPIPNHAPPVSTGSCQRTTIMSTRPQWGNDGRAIGMFATEYIHLLFCAHSNFQARPPSRLARSLSSLPNHSLLVSTRASSPPRADIVTV